VNRIVKGGNMYTIELVKLYFDFRPNPHGADADGVAIFAGDAELRAKPLERGKKGHGNFQSAFLIDLQ
jgi:hypothetical protein